MNVSTWSRDHFLQNTWRTMFSTFTVGLLLDLSVREAGQAGLYVGLFFSLWSMFYHSAIRIHLPWLDRVLVTPQVHRIHHSEKPEHYNKNFADFLPLFDIVFGTYHSPRRDEFPATGLGADYPAPRNVFTSQLRPVAKAAQVLARRSERSPS
jgi:sterol desaturase/sphingolipid hydroxylase (fatty acid hydroxylase superfamily)